MVPVGQRSYALWDEQVPRDVRHGQQDGRSGDVTRTQLGFYHQLALGLPVG